jgi:hypothetical protein
VARIELTPTTLVVHIEGADRFLALKTHVEVPLEHIAGVDASVPDAHDVWHGLKVAGSNLPGVVTAGRFLQSGGLAFWDVHDPDHAIGIRLHDEHYSRLVIGVDDPAGEAAAISAAVAAAH